MVASLTLNKPSPDSHKDSSSGSGQKDYFQVTDELSRENSHFSLSEALITIVEQYKANTTEARQETLRGERDQQATPPPDPMDAAPNSDLYTTSPPPRSWGSLSSIATEDSVDEFSLQKSTPKISLVDLMRNAGSAVQSAESTAQRLLQFIAAQYSGVESEDIGNSSTVLTLPVDFLCSLRQDEDLQKSVTTSNPPTRGSKDWAPPRAQIIFHIKTPQRNMMKHLAAQGYRCTGCGMRQEPSQARHFRFCNYTGKYFCQKCHSNASSIVPAYVLHRWSFKKYYVSNFAHDLLERIHYEPVFDLNNINPQIYTTVPLLAQARDMRMQLVAVKKYLKTCRQAQSLTATFDGYIPWTADVHTYSIDDFLQIKLKLRYLRSLLQDSIKHVKSCPVSTTLLPLILLPLSSLSYVM
jgi:run domain Beclin-1 interacting cysteine-rich containing protein